MGSLRQALQELPSAGDWHFWSADYKTHLHPFIQGARDLKAAFEQQPHDFTNTVLVGFSMGGLVARRLVAEGFPCRALVTICSPHQGVAPWVLTHSPGTWSLSRRSPHLVALNRNPLDRAHRPHYYLFAITYTDIGGYHDDDTIVTARSALGANLGQVALRKKIHIDYGRTLGRRLSGSPHVRGMNPRYLTPVLQTCNRLFTEI
jgi:pimeloyl-ACP methyl ester carboxylesterase